MADYKVPPYFDELSPKIAFGNFSNVSCGGTYEIFQDLNETKRRINPFSSRGVSYSSGKYITLK